MSNKILAVGQGLCLTDLGGNSKKSHTVYIWIKLSNFFLKCWMFYAHFYGLFYNCPNIHNIPKDNLIYSINASKFHFQNDSTSFLNEGKILSSSTQNSANYLTCCWEGRWWHHWSEQQLTALSLCRISHNVFFPLLLYHSPLENVWEKWQIWWGFACLFVKQGGHD